MDWDKKKEKNIPPSIQEPEDKCKKIHHLKVYQYKNQNKSRELLDSQCKIAKENFIQSSMMNLQMEQIPFYRWGACVKKWNG